MPAATRSNPRLWQRAKREACRHHANLCPHSARKMQWAVAWYKKHGGTYVGRKSPTNSLARWTRERWRTASGKPSNGVRRYLPSKAWDRLTPSQVRRTNASKARGHRLGKQWVSQPKDVARVARRYRNDR